MTPIVDLPPVEQQALLSKFRTEQQDKEKRNKLKQASQERVDDLKDISFELLYREVGDGALAKMAHVNSLARRISDLEGNTDEFFDGPVKEKELNQGIKYIATPGEVAADEVFLVAKKVQEA